MARFVGRLDREMFKGVTVNIVTDEVIITEEQIQHIRERHPNDFERYERCLREIVEEPDFILEANRPASAVLLKEHIELDKRFYLVLRLQTQDDPAERKNSIITFLKTNEKEWRRFLKNKKILYKRV